MSVPSRAIQLLRSIDPNLAQMAQEAYDHLIDFGAHPNALIILDSLKVKELDEGTQVSLVYLHAFDGVPIVRSLLACFETAVSAVLIFTQVFRHTEEAKVVHSDAFELWKVDLQKFIDDGDYERVAIPNKLPKIVTCADGVWIVL